MGNAKSAAVLYPCAGLSVYIQLPDSPVRGSASFVPPGGAARFFAVAGATLFEVVAGAPVNRGSVANDGLPASLAYNQANQLMVASGGIVYCFNLSTGGFGAVGGLGGAVAQIGFSNGYFLAPQKGTNKFQVSALLDGTTWTGIGPTTNVIQEFADAIQSMVCDHQEVWFFSGTHGIGYYNSGSTNIFDPIGPASFTEDGIGSTNSVIKADNTFYWINASERGGGIAKKLSGTTPVRISNHAIEYQWSTYPTIADAIGFAFEDQGHTFIQWYFPTASKTWVYDVETGSWHKRGFWDAANGKYTAHRSMCHSYFNGQHIVGDWASGNLYTQSIQNLSDFGNVIRRVRIAPPISNENEYIYHHRLQIDMECGLASFPTNSSYPLSFILQDPNSGNLWSVAITDAGLLQTTQVGSGTPATVLLNDVADGTTYQIGITSDGLLLTIPVTSVPSAPQIYSLATTPNFLNCGIFISNGLLNTAAPNAAQRGPLLSMTYTDDGGHSWSNEATASAGKLGEYSTRLLYYQLGRSRQRSYQIVATDMAPWRIIEGDLIATGYEPKKRLAKQFAEAS